MDKQQRDLLQEGLFQLALILVSGLVMVLLLWWIHYPTWKKMSLLMRLENRGRNSSRRMGELSGQQLADVAAFVKSIHDWEREQILGARKRDKRSASRRDPEESD